MAKLVSILIPAFNGEKYIKDAIESALGQNYANFEIVISDGGSTDKTEEICLEYSRVSKIRYIKSSNKLTIAENWNVCLVNAKGVYIKFLCHDDILAPDCLTELVAVLENDQSVELVTSYEQFFGDRDGIRKIGNIQKIYLQDGSTICESILLDGNWLGGPSAVMFRASAVHRLGFFRTDFSGALDLEYWLRLLSTGNLYVIPKLLFSTRVHQNQATKACDSDLLFEKEHLVLVREHFAKPSKEMIVAIMRSYKRMAEVYFAKSNPASKIELIKVIVRSRGLGIGLFIFSCLRLKVSSFSGKIRSRLGRKAIPKKLAGNFNPGVRRIKLPGRSGGGDIRVLGSLRLSLDAIKIRYCTANGIKLASIESSPHYKFINGILNSDDLGDPIEYRQYVTTYFPDIDHAAQIQYVKQLVRQLQETDKIDPVIIYLPKNESEVVVFDGTHRLAFHKARGDQSILCLVADAAFNSQWA